MLTIDCVPRTFIEILPEGTSIHGILAAFLTNGDPHILTKWDSWRRTWPNFQSFRDCMPILWLESLQTSTCMADKKLGSKYGFLPPAFGFRNIVSENPMANDREEIYQNILANQEKRAQAAWECVLQAFPDTDWETFCYHWLIINTRSFYYVTPGKEEPKDWNDAVGLVPIADYFNHADDAVS